MVPTDTISAPQLYLQSPDRWSAIEIAFWLATLLPFFLFPNYLSLASQIAITALFALSLDLILGYAGVVSLGHAAFFGIGAYAAGLFSKFVWGEPISGLSGGGTTRRPGRLCHQLYYLRFRHLTLIMLTLGLGLLAFEVANSAHWLPAAPMDCKACDLAALRHLQVRPLRLHGVQLFVGCTVPVFSGHAPAGPFAVRAGALRGIRENLVRMPAIGAASRAHIRKAYTIAAAVAGIAGALLTQTTEIRRA